MAAVSQYSKRLCPVLIILLVTGYLSLLYLVLNPKVSAEYRNYYIDRNTTLTPFEQQKAARGLGTPMVALRFDDADARFDGWSAAEETHRWSEGKQAEIVFRMPGNLEPKGIVILTARYLGDQRVTMTLNGRVIAAFESRTTPADLMIDIDPTLLKPGAPNRLTFDLPLARPPGNGDQRLLAMALLGIEIH